MSLDKIINKAKPQKEEISTVSLTMPTVLKNQLTDITKANEITVSAFINALVDDALNGKTEAKSNLEIVTKLDSLCSQRDELDRVHAETGGDRFLYLANGQEMNLEERMNEVNLMIRLLKRGL